MKKKLLFVFILSAVFVSCQSARGQKSAASNDNRVKKVVYFDPEVDPDLDEIKEPTNTAFFSAVSDRVNSMKNRRMIRVESPLKYDSIDTATVSDICMNNGADFAVVPKVKYFKVGFGQYVFSNQVVVSMKLYSAAGDLLAETSYDTYRRNIRLLGSEENSVKIGTNGAISNILKDLRKVSATRN